MSWASDEECTVPTSISWQELLIECVKCRPALFDKHNRDYNDTRGVKRNLWLDVSKTLIEAGHVQLKDVETSPESCQAKWESIRDSFKRNVVKREAAMRSGASGKNLPTKYVYYDIMEWLNHVNKKRSSTTNLSNVVEAVSLPSTSGEDTASTSSVRLEALPDTITMEPPIVSKSSAKKRRKLIDDNDDLENVLMAQMKSTGHMISKIHEQSTEKPQLRDADELFGELVASSLREIPNGLAKERLKIAIQQQILETKFANEISP